MNVWPLKFRQLPSGALLFADDAGGFFRSDEVFLDRYAGCQLRQQDYAFLHTGGHAYENENDLPWTAFAYRWARRQAVPHPLSYLILVPTLRCNLACGYCQVSRVAESARGFDWTEERLEQVLRFLDAIETNDIKIEFQGGEPMLRLDLLQQVRAFCRKRFRNSQFVVCTNLQIIDADGWAFLGDADTFISTSLDGTWATHQRQRTKDTGQTASFFKNLAYAVDRFGGGKVSALPTIDPVNALDFDELLDTFAKYGFRSIYLRPVNHQGFARKAKLGMTPAAKWNRLHAAFIDHLIERNAVSDVMMEEFYFSHCLRRVLRPGLDSHVDIRNPAFLGRDYLVVDFDGSLYPTDEARMQSRIGRIDLSVGDLASGVDTAKLATLNGSAMNNFDADCVHCPYQPYCGSDVVDDISRYGRIDLPRHQTWFCGRQLGIFDKVFEVLYRRDAAARKSVAHWAGVAQWSPDMVAHHP